MPAKRRQRLLEQLLIANKGLIAEVQADPETGAITRVVFRGAAPVLPPPAKAEQDPDKAPLNDADLVLSVPEGMHYPVPKPEEVS